MLGSCSFDLGCSDVRDGFRRRTSVTHTKRDVRQTAMPGEEEKKEDRWLVDVL
jgi:hypothetical protein